MKRKLLAMALCLGMVLTTIGCGSTDEKTTQSSSESKTTQSKETSSETPKTEEKEEPVKLRLEQWSWSDLPEGYGTLLDNKWINMIKDIVLEELNIELELVDIPRLEEYDKLNALIAAGTEPDLYYGYGLDNVSAKVDMGALADLSKYMDTEAGKSIIETFGENVVSYGILNGKQYAIPAPNYKIGGYSIFVRKDYLDAVGVELQEKDGHYIITPSELMEAMIDVKEQGLCDYPLGMVNNDGMYDNCLMGSFIEEITNEKILGDVTQLEGYKEGYRWLNNCYHEDLINPDYGLFTIEQVREAISTGNVAVWSWQHNDGGAPMIALFEAYPDAELVCVEMVHEDGRPAYYPTQNSYGVFAMVSSNASEEVVDAAIRYLNWQASSEMAHLIANHGFEGEHWEYNEDGYMAQIDPEYNSKDRAKTGFQLPFHSTDPFCNKTLEQIEYGMRNNGTVDPKTAEAMVQGMYVCLSEGKYEPPVLSKPVTAAIDYATQLSVNKTNLHVQSICAPVGQFDEVYDELLETYWNEGGSQVAEEKLQIWESQQ